MNGLYVNGSQVFSTAFSGAESNSGQNLSIGQSGNGADYWKGVLDEVALYNTALSAFQAPVRSCMVTSCRCA